MVAEVVGDAEAGHGRREESAQSAQDSAQCAVGKRGETSAAAIAAGNTGDRMALGSCA
jgi:hypothetical protein